MNNKYLPSIVDTGADVNILSEQFLSKLEDFQVINDKNNFRIHQVVGKCQILKIISVITTIGKISKPLIFYVIKSDLPYLLLSIDVINLFKLNINFSNKKIYQFGKEVTYKKNYCDYKCLAFHNYKEHLSGKNWCQIKSFMNDEYDSYPSYSNYESVNNNSCKYGFENMYNKMYNNIIDNYKCEHGKSGDFRKFSQNLIHKQNESKIKSEDNINFYMNDENKLVNLIKEYDNIFSKSRYDIGEIKMEAPRVILNSEIPISNRPYRASPRDNAEIKRQLDALLEAGIIKPSYSAYSSPITLAYKRDEQAKTRLCCDYRKINNIAKNDSEPIPRIDAVLDQLVNARVFSKLDLTSGYWHIKLHDEDTEKLAFTSNYGLFEWTRMPFGYKNAPGAFNRAIRRILNKHKVQYAINYFDDIVIFSQNFNDHIQHLKHFFDICQQENLKLKLSKCEFAKTKINYLGYEIGEGKYSPANANIEVIKKLQPPKTVKQLQRFLGSINVYNKFIHNYAKLRNPLNNLLKKDKKFIWNEQCQQSFETLKNSLISKPILRLFQPNLPCHLFVDASGEAVSGILKQEQSDGELHPVAFHSRKLKDYEKNYTITELECLAIIDAIDKFYYYLHGIHFTIHTDHAALVWLKKIKRPTGRLFRWSLKLSMFNFDIKYKKGSTNVEADFLTRSEIANFVKLRVQLLSKEELVVAQEKENLCNKKYHKINDLLTVRRQGLNKIVVPYSLRLKILETAHQQYGHVGISSMLNLISPLYYWQGIINDVKNYVRHCEVCQLNKKSNQKKFGLLEEMPTSSTPFELLSIDTVGGLGHYNSTKCYLHVVLDHATRYVWTFASKSVSTDTYISCLKQIFQIQIPKQLLSDRNPAFTSSKFKHFLSKNGIKQLLTSSFRPQCNGKSERIGQSLITRLRCKFNSLENNNISWPRLITQVTEEYNHTPHQITKFPPLYLMYGTLPYESPMDYNVYPSVEESRKIAEQRTKESQKVNKKYYDIKHKQMSFELGDEVMYEEPNFIKGKLCKTFSGPFFIIEKLSNVNYKISKPNHHTKQDFEIVHISKLRLFNSPEKFYLKEPEIKKSKENKFDFNMDEETQIYSINSIQSLPNTVDHEKFKLKLKSKIPIRIKPLCKN